MLRRLRVRSLATRGASRPDRAKTANVPQVRGYRLRWQPGSACGSAPSAAREPRGPGECEGRSVDLGTSIGAGLGAVNVNCELVSERPIIRQLGCSRRPCVFEPPAT